MVCQVCTKNWYLYTGAPVEFFDAVIKGFEFAVRFEYVWCMYV